MARLAIYIITIYGNIITIIWAILYTPFAKSPIFMEPFAVGFDKCFQSCGDTHVPTCPDILINGQKTISYRES